VSESIALRRNYGICSVVLALLGCQDFPYSIREEGGVESLMLLDLEMTVFRFVVFAN
jgi:hypothetical protein